MTAGTADAALVGALRHAAGLAGEGRVLRLDHGMSGDVVLRIEGANPLYAKIGDPTRRISCGELAREVAVLRWLGGRAGAARLAWAGEVGGRPAMVTEAIEGSALHELPAERAESGARASLAALTALHRLPITDCPFDERLAVKLAEAGRRVAAGEVDLAQLEPANAGRSAEALWRDLISRRPPDEDLVVTHGDACWPNFILRPDGGAGMVDLGRAGVADRHQDLALFIRSAEHNFPDLPIRELVATHYRLATLDGAKLEFYRELDEFY